VQESKQLEKLEQWKAAYNEGFDLKRLKQLADESYTLVGRDDNLAAERNLHINEEREALVCWEALVNWIWSCQGFLRSYLYELENDPMPVCSNETLRALLAKTQDVRPIR